MKKFYFVLNRLQLKAIINEEWKDIYFKKVSFNRYDMRAEVNGVYKVVGCNLPKKDKKFIELIINGMHM